MFPSVIKLLGVQCPDKRTYGTGGFADVYRGKYEGKDVALKRLRVFSMIQESKKEASRKVRFVLQLRNARANCVSVSGFLSRSLAMDRSKAQACYAVPWGIGRCL